MAIKTETAESLAALATGAEKAPETPAEPAEAASEQPEQAAPEAPEAEESEEKAPKWYRERLKSLTREKRDLEELAREEYETRMALQEQLKTKQPAPEADARPDRSKYKAEEADQYEDDLLAWNRRQTLKDFEATREQERINAKVAAQYEAGRSEFEDWDTVIQRAASRGQKPGWLSAALIESDVGHRLVHHLATNQKVERELLSLPPAAALLKLGEIQTQLRKEPEAKADAKVEAKPAAVTKPITRAPPPIPPLTSGTGDVPTDLSAIDGSKPGNWQKYRAMRLEEKAKGRRAH